MQREKEEIIDRTCGQASPPGAGFLLDEPFEHGLPHQSGRQESLRKKKVVKGLSVKLLAEEAFGVSPKLHKPFAAAEVRSGLAWSAKRVAFHFLYRGGDAFTR